MLNTPDSQISEMLLHASAADDRGHLATEEERRSRLPPPHQADVITYDWAQIGMGIALAGGVYPLVVASLMFVVGLISFLLATIAGSVAGPEVEMAVQAVFTVFIFAVFGAFVGLTYACLVSVMMLPIMYLVVWSLQLRRHIVQIGAFAGGLIGFIAILPLTLSITWDLNFGGLGDMALLLALGPGLTTILGQIGGAWGGSKSRALGPDPAAYRAILAEAGGWEEPHAPPTADDVAGINSRSQPFQFGIRHLLWTAVWLSLLLTVIRLSGVPFEFALLLLAGWFAYQAVTLRFGGWLLRWRQRRRELKRLRTMPVAPNA